MSGAGALPGAMAEDGELRGAKRPLQASGSPDRGASAAKSSRSADLQALQEAEAAADVAGAEELAKLRAAARAAANSIFVSMLGSVGSQESAAALLAGAALDPDAPSPLLGGVAALGGGEASPSASSFAGVREQLRNEEAAANALTYPSACASASASSAPATALGKVGIANSFAGVGTSVGASASSALALALGKAPHGGGDGDETDALVLQQAHDMLNEAAINERRRAAAAKASFYPLKLVPPAKARGLASSTVPIGAQLMAAAQHREQLQRMLGEASNQSWLPTEAQELAGPHTQAATQIYMLAQLAEESAQMAASAAACCASSEADPVQASALSQAAQEAGARASWAASTMDSCFPTDECLGEEHLEWCRALRQIVRQSAESAEHASRNCRLQATDIARNMPMVAIEKKSRVPCKWYLAGSCRKAGMCEFSHDLVDMQPRPLNKKRAELCNYWLKGSCTRGTACPFAHGDEELGEISRIVSDLKTEKRLFTKPYGRY